jgi:hypothetical protein
VAQFTTSEGHPSWAEVAAAMAQLFDSGYRNTKACRERWFHHLRPGLTDAEWTPAEEIVLFQLQSLHGNKWTNISDHLPGRSDQVSCLRVLTLSPISIVKATAVYSFSSVVLCVICLKAVAPKLSYTWNHMHTQNFAKEWQALHSHRCRCNVDS